MLQFSARLPIIATYNGKVSYNHSQVGWVEHNETTYSNISLNVVLLPTQKQVISSLLLKTFKDGKYTDPLGNLLQFCALFPIKMFSYDFLKVKGLTCSII